MSKLPAMKRAIAVVGVAACVTGFAGCGGGKGSEPPVAALRNSDAPERARIEAVERSRDDAKGNGASLAARRQAIKDIVWTPTQPAKLRVAAMRSLLNDADPAAVSDARELGKLILPREQSREMVILLGQTAADRGWDDYVPALVRAYARPARMGVKEEERAERTALKQIRPNTPVEEVVLDVFLHPPQAPASYGLDWTQRTRNDAWELLSRLDRDGALRRRVLAADSGVGAEDATVLAIRKSVSDLRAMPISGDQLNWVLSLTDPKKTENAAWWAEAAGAIAESAQNELEIRHAEAIRWARANKPGSVRATRAELLSQVRSRLEGRVHNQRTAEDSSRRVSERFGDWEQKLTWADALCVLLVDDALHDPGVVDSLFKQVELDRKDSTTEYGGVLYEPSREGAGARAALFPPRPGQRRGDDQFVASDDMIAASDRALAHYHFHVQHRRGVEYAGPSPGDLDYALRYGRTCVVLSSIADGVLGVDLYQPNGVVLDLGDIKAGRPEGK